MDRNVNLGQIRQKVYTSYHEDGIIDVFIALFIMGFAVWMLLDMIWLAGGFVIFGVSIYAAAKRAFTVPRVGFVKLRPQRTMFALGVVLGLMMLSSILGLVAFMQVEGGGTPVWLSLAIEYYMPLIGVSVGALFCLAGYTFRTRRMYGYALLTLVMFAIGHFIYYPLHYYVITLGIVILIFGLFMLISFVSKYPITDNATSESNNEK